jgi:hypothetical protein
VSPVNATPLVRQPILIDDLDHLRRRNPVTHIHFCAQRQVVLPIRAEPAALVTGVDRLDAHVNGRVQRGVRSGGVVGKAEDFERAVHGLHTR